MKILVDDIKEVPKTLAYAEPVDELNQRLGRGVQDFRVADGLEVEVEYYRAGLDLFFRGTLHGDAVGTCARCLEEYPFHVDHPFVFVVVPRAAEPASGGELSVDDVALSTYEGNEVDLSPHVYEEMILALPMRALCAEDCLGLCARCGANLNAGSCACSAAPASPRVMLPRGR